MTAVFVRAGLDSLPMDLPVPQDDGACDHLPGQRLPDCWLSSTSRNPVNLAQQPDWLVLYCYPMTGRPDVPLPAGWDEIPGARGCTPQACAFRDHHHELEQLNVHVYGLSTQSTAYQTEAAARLHLPFALLSDEQFHVIDSLKLPTFLVHGMRMVKRLTLIVRNGVIQHVLYPVFPPDQNADQVITWLRQQQ